MPCLIALCIPTNDEEKRCPKCKQKKVLRTGFSKNKASATGYNCWCKTCMAAAQRARRLLAGEHVRALEKRIRTKHAGRYRALAKDRRKKNLIKYRLRDRQWWSQNAERLSVKKRALYKISPEIRLRSTLANRRRKYGLTSQELQNLLLQQKGFCAICATPVVWGDILTHVDHDHATGNVRGILCGHCNRGLGGFRDKPELLEKAIHYLLLHKVTKALSQINSEDPQQVKQEL